MKVLISGSRDITAAHIDIAQIVRDSKFTVSTLLSGGAKGVDTLAINWARSVNIPVEIYRPDWKLGRSAGIMRNLHMLDMCDSVICVWDKQSAGTRQVISEAKRRELPLYVVEKTIYHCLACENPEMVFVYGSNRAGRHGAGAAYHALQYHGAKPGKTGFNGHSYGINTKDEHLHTLSLDDIQIEVNEFVNFARAFKNMKFFVTAVGTGLAGIDSLIMKDMFKVAPSNCILADNW